MLILTNNLELIDKNRGMKIISTKNYTLDDILKIKAEGTPTILYSNISSSSYVWNQLYNLADIVIDDGVKKYFYIDPYYKDLYKEEYMGTKMIIIGEYKNVVFVYFEELNKRFEIPTHHCVPSEKYEKLFKGDKNVF